MKSLRALRMHSNAERNAKTLQKCRRFVNNAFNGIGDDCARAQLDHWPVQFPCLVVASFCSSAHTHKEVYQVLLWKHMPLLLWHSRQGFF